MIEGEVATVAGASDSTPAPTNDTAQVEATTPAQPQAEAQGEVAASTDTQELLISDEDFEKLQDNPAALRKALQSSYTQKTQEIAPARRLYEALARDPQGVIRALAQAAKIPIAEQPVTPAGVATNVAQQQAKDELLEAFSEVLGPENAQRLRPALDQFISQKLQPIQQWTEAQMATAAADQARMVEQQFTTMYPDWKKYEKDMVAISKKVEPRGMSPIEYMDVLYKLAANESMVAKSVSGVVKRMQTSASAIAEARTSGVSPSQVTNTIQRGKLPTLDEALAAAARGERLE